ncbi:DUF3618 domain-containing protein [Streptomyces niger]|uniref:DUF3618 domain-containing protein n=1 Tax=Streptomyces niger TaxID=66373 RepID=UPI00069C4700|nr:DUF3618 domain-containing protein [Streptomyces niger]
MTAEPRSRNKSESLTTEQLRERVEHTREELGRTVEELAAKADVKTRAKEKAGEAKAKVQGKAGDARAKVQQAVGHSRARAQDGSAHVAQRGPVPALAVSAAAAVLIWLQVRRHGRDRKGVRTVAIRSGRPRGLAGHRRCGSRTRRFR